MDHTMLYIMVSTSFYLLSSYYPHSQWDPWDLTEEPNSVRKVKSERTLEEGKHRDMQVFNVV